MNSIGGIKINSPLILAPMAGLFNLPLRLTFRDFGFGLVSIGSISAEAVVLSGNGRLFNLCGQEEFTDTRETPLMIQLIGSDPGMMAGAAVQIQEKTDIIDLNFGCPLKRFTSKGWGAALLQDIGKMRAVIKAVVRAVCIPVTVKIRIVSLKDHQSTLDMACCCQDSGVAAIVIHARTPQEGFRGQPHWDIFRRLREVLSIPIIGNGGVKDMPNAENLLENYGCDFVMVGSAAMRNPLNFCHKSSGSQASFNDVFCRHACHKRNKFLKMRSSLDLRFIRFKMERFIAHAR